MTILSVDLLVRFLETRKSDKKQQLHKICDSSFVKIYLIEWLILNV